MNIAHEWKLTCSSEKHLIKHDADELLYLFFKQILGTFHWLSLVEIGIVLIQVNHLVLRKELIWELKDSINPSICVTLHSLDKNWPLVWLLMIHYTFPRTFCIIYCCIVSTLHHSQEFVAEIKPLQSNSAFFSLAYLEATYQSD